MFVVVDVSGPLDVRVMDEENEMPTCVMICECVARASTPPTQVTNNELGLETTSTSTLSSSHLWQHFINRSRAC